MANINIFALGGQDENGKDLYVLEVEQDIYIINIGIKFPINDRWGVDGIIADTTYLKERQDRIKGLFITHAQDESFAAIAWLLMDIKGLNIYSSAFTKELIQNRVSKYKIGHNDYKFHELTESKIGAINVKAYDVASSIPGAKAFEFKTPDGSIYFASEMTIGDLGPFGTTNLDSWNKENVLALIADSRRANYNDKSFEKKSIKEMVEPIFKKAKENERILVGAYDEQMFTLQEIIELANKYNRPIAFYGSAYDINFQAMLKHYKGVEKPLNVISYKDVGKSKNAVVLITGMWSRIYQRFQRITSGNDVFLKFLSTDHAVMITPPRNGMEVEYSVALDDITRITSNILSISNQDFSPIRLAKPDIKEFVSKIKPKIFVPISSLYRYQAVANQQAKDAGVLNNNTVQLQNGKILYIKDGEIASQKGRVKKVGDVIIQGFGYGDVSYEVIKERKTLAAGGLISISAQYNRRTRQLVGSLNTQIVGLVVKTELAHYIELINSIVIQKFEEAERVDFREIQNSIRKRVQKQIRKAIDKEPLVVITFYEV